MTEPVENAEQQVELNRLTTAEFLMQLDVAKTWGIYVNPGLEEIELIVKDGDDEPKVFHGPDPLSIPYQKYKEFCREVEEMAERKSEQEKASE